MGININTEFIHQPRCIRDDDDDDDDTQKWKEDVHMYEHMHVLLPFYSAP